MSKRGRGQREGTLTSREARRKVRGAVRVSSESERVVGYNIYKIKTVMYKLTSRYAHKWTHTCILNILDHPPLTQTIDIRRTGLATRTGSTYKYISYIYMPKHIATTPRSSWNAY